MLIDSTFSLTSLFWGLRFVNRNSGVSKELFFLPRPIAPFEFQSEQDLLAHKKLKKIQYFSFDAFQQVQKSWQRDLQHFAFNLLDLEAVGEKFACTKREIESLGIKSADIKDLKFLAIQTNPRVVVSRASDESDNFYYQEALVVTHQQMNDYDVYPFMYFFWRGEFDQRLTAVIRLMADEGLGGKRSQGMGIFSKIEEVELPEDLFAGESECYASLSTVFPRYDEVDKMLFYELTERSGFLHSKQGRSLRKKRVNLLKEGSIFSAKISGQLVDVQPSGFSMHPVYLNGQGFLVPIGEV
jgi:CRISPR-associated protein Csm4